MLVGRSLQVIPVLVKRRPKARPHPPLDIAPLGQIGGVSDPGPMTASTSLLTFRFQLHSERLFRAKGPSGGLPESERKNAETLSSDRLGPGKVIMTLSSI